MTTTDEGSKQRVEVLWNENNATGVADTLRYFPRRDGVLFTDARFTNVKGGYTIRDPAGKQIDQDMSFDGSVTLKTNGCFEIAKIWDGTSYLLAEDYIVDWQVRFTDANSSEGFYNERQFFDVVRTKLQCMVDHKQLVELFPDLTQQLASIGATDSVAWIRSAWSEVLDRIRSGGHRPSLIMDGTRLRAPTLHLAVSKVADALTREANDVWYGRADVHMKRYEQAWNALGQLKYDFQQTGLASPLETSRVGRRRFRV